MKKNFVLAMLLCAGLLLCGRTALAATVVQTDVTTAGDGCVMLELEGRYITDTENALARINAIRLEACKEGVINPSTGEALTEDDYVPIRWSSDLEYIARIRAAESSLTMAHTRTNGSSCFDISSANGVESYGEVLAWNYSKSVLYGINQWYGEKADWVNQTDGAVTGHYTAMINPKNRYVGLGTFYTTNAGYPNTTAGEFSKVSSGLDETPMDAVDDCLQLLEVEEDKVTYAVSGTNSGKKGDQISLKMQATYTGGTTGELLVPEDGITWSSSSPEVASVSADGTVTVNTCGSATITAAAGTGSASLSFTANHISVTDAAVAATCVSTGKTEGSHCSVCGTVLTAQETTAVDSDAHQWEEKTTKATLKNDGKIRKECSLCGRVKEETVSRPKTFTLSQTSYTYNGKERKPSVKVVDAAGNKISSANYSLTYASGRKNVGKYTVKITFKGNYEGTKTLSFRINPKSTSIRKLTAGKKKLTVKWKKQTMQVTGYQIQVSTKKNFSSGNKTVTVKKNSTTSATVSKLKKGKKYYVRIRTYKTVSGKKYYSAWSSKKSVKIKK